MNSLSALGETWPLTVRITTDGMRSLWRELNRFSGSDAAERAFRQSHNDLRNEKHFRNAIRLADEYFLAYEDAAESIDALLMYYGSMWLGHAVNYVTHSHDTMSKRTKGHGVHPIIDVGKKWPFIDSKIEVKDRNATFNLTNMAFGGDDLTGHTFDLLDFLRAMPELDEHLEQVTGSGTSAFRFAEMTGFVGDWYNTTGRISVQLIGGSKTAASEGYFSKHIAVSEYLVEHEVAYTEGQVSWTRSRSGSDELNAISISTGTSRFFSPKIQGLKVAEFTLYLGALHALSELVRYDPDTLIDILEKSGDEYFIIRQFMHVAEEKVPLLVLNHLRKADFLFRSRSSN